MHDQRQSNAFPPGGIADIEIDHGSIHVRLTEIQRALVAHDALCTRLEMVGVQMPVPMLWSAIEKASDLGLICRGEERYLKFYNSQANASKHKGFPF